MYLTRTIEKNIRKLNGFFPVLLVTGPRQAGKTTVLRACACGGRNYVSLDSMENRLLARRDPALFLQRYRAPLFIDEIQHAPELFPYIKAAVDERKEAGMYWLAGSRQLHLMKNVTESLAGRVGILRLAGLTQAESEGQPDRPPFLPSPERIESRTAHASETDPASLYHRIWKGTYPGMCDAPDETWPLFYDSYVRTYIERDVRDMGVMDELAFFEFMRRLAAGTARFLNYSEISRDLGVSQSTVKSWLSILQASGLIFLLPPYPANANGRRLKTPKIYFYDTGLVCRLLGWNTPLTLERGAMSKEILETYVVSEMAKSFMHHGVRNNMYYYRDRDKCEIDVLIEDNGILYPVGIERKSNPGMSDVKAFDVIGSVLKKKRGHGAVLCMARARLPITEDVDAVPISCV